jgi:archaellum component FlaD/FlaE
MGMVALGFGFLFMQRMNEDDAIYTDSEHEAQPQEQPKMANEVEEKVEEKADVEETTSEPAQEEESVDEGDAEDDEFSEIEAILEEESTVEEEKPVSKDHSGLLPTSEGFALRLPKEAVNNILASLESTPHDGYTPVVAFGPTGQIMLTFEPEA